VAVVDRADQADQGLGALASMFWAAVALSGAAAWTGFGLVAAGLGLIGGLAAGYCLGAVDSGRLRRLWWLVGLGIAYCAIVAVRLRPT